MARKPPRKDPVAELAEKLLRVLRAQRGLGADSYPLTVQRLAELTDPAAAPAVLKKALNKKSFKKEALAVRAKAPAAPIALASDAELLAASTLAIEFLLGQCRTAATQAFGVPDLKKKATNKLHKPLHEALSRHLAAGTLPPTVGWVTISGRKKLFLVSDAHIRGGRPATEPAPAAPPVLAATRPFAEAFAEAFARLDRDAGGHNFVSLVALRRALGLDRTRFDEGLRELRRAGRYALSAAEGRDGIAPEERDAGIAEEGSLLLFVSRSPS